MTQKEKNSQVKIKNLKKQLEHVPTSAGCYLWKDESGNVIYVGKAKNLRARMRQYINYQDSREKIPLLVDDIDSFDYIVVKNENESLILEKNLINQYKPFYNADFKDDKSYPFIAITEGDLFPAIKYTREKHKANTRYFGPYTDSRAARKTVDIVRKIVPICASSCATWRRLQKGTVPFLQKVPNLSSKRDRPWTKGSFGVRPQKRNLHDEDDEIRQFLESLEDNKACFDCSVGLGPGACCGEISPQDYSENVKKVEHFLNGNQRDFLNNLNDEMNEAAQNLDFERAGRVKDRIDTINSLTEQQHIVSQQNLNADVIGFYREETIAGVHLLMVREGRIINSNEFILNRGLDISDEELVHMFLLRYYDNTTSIPRMIILRDLPDDAQQMKVWLSEKLDSSHGAKLKFETPQQGEKMKMLKMAELNAKHSLMRYKVRTNYDDKRINNALLQLESALAMESSPMRIECFDISTIHGSYTVASMVVFTGGKSDKNQYRRFKIKTALDEANDFLSMQEVLRRRYCKERMQDKRFGEKPDLILLDGGKPQLSAALKIFDELGLDLQKEKISLAGLAKSDEELILPLPKKGQSLFGQNNRDSNQKRDRLEFSNVILPDGSESLCLVKAVRDEAHRFAISFHRQLRAKGMTASILDEIPGLGPVRKKALLKSFGSFKKIKEASLEEIKNKKIIPVDVARELFLILHQNDN